MYTTKDIESITVQSVYLIIIRMNDNKSYVIGANELVDIINKELYLKSTYLELVLELMTI